MVARGLLEEHAEVVISDPKAMDNARTDLGKLASRVTFEADPYEAAKGAHAVAVLTEWPQFAALDYERIYQGMVHPAFIFDGRNILPHKALHAMGFHVYPIGKPALLHGPTTR